MQDLECCSNSSSSFSGRSTPRSSKEELQELEGVRLFLLGEFTEAALY